MDIQLLEDIGLTKAQAAAYQALVRRGASKAPAIAKDIGESRSNTYKVLDKLCELGLATKDRGAQVIYHPASPAALEQLIHNQVKQMSLRERKLKAAMPDLLTYFFTHSEQPGVRYFQGKEGLEQIYKDELATGKPVHYIRTMDDVRFLGFDELHRLRNLFPRLGVPRSAITQDVAPDLPPGAPTMPIATSDQAMLLTRTWIRPEDYDEPVEWAVYGDKLAIVSYGQEAIGMIIESKQIAQAFRRIFGLLDEGIRRRPGYNQLPLRATHTAVPVKRAKNKTAY